MNDILNHLMGDELPDDVVEAISRNKKCMKYLKDEIAAGCTLREAIMNCFELNVTVTVQDCDGRTLMRLEL